MKIQFDSNQEFQKDAIDAVVDLFDGNNAIQQQTITLDLMGQQTMEGQIGFANQFILSNEMLLENIKKIQTRNGITPTIETLDELKSYDFSIEMETGTGKTYVYLRTIFELYQKYGFTKYVIVVPSIAIREGVKKSIDLMKDHFAELYNNVQYDSYIYDSDKLTYLRQFSQANTIQILIINLDAFNKETNVIHRPNENLNGLKPIHFINQVRPIVIMDEPQNMETERSKWAIQTLNPLVKLRYSATHRYTYNLLYRLDPVQAYRMGLVKRIGVTSIVTENEFNQPYIQLNETVPTKRSVSAKLEIHAFNNEGSVIRKRISVRAGDDLFEKSNGRYLYEGYIVREIHHGEGYIEFTNDKRVYTGNSLGVDRDAMMKVQIFETVKAHLDKELEVSKLPEGKRLKVLSLFFIDRVANYAEENGKIRKWFNEAYKTLVKNVKYAKLNLPDVNDVQGSYFSQDKGKAKDTRGNSKLDEDTYELIMKDKERLLSLNEPVRFIFSHSALREGWDNPNVFQICTLNETQSEIKKRQEIGRGLRLPINESGERVFDEQINRLTVVANEHYEDFAKGLQKEMKDAGYEFAKEHIDDNRERKPVKLMPKWRENKEFLELWDRIKHKTRYSVHFDQKELIEKAANRIAQINIQPPKLRIEGVNIELSQQGVDSEVHSIRHEKLQSLAYTIPNIIEHIQKSTQLKRKTIIEILKKANCMDKILINPQRFMEETIQHIKATMTGLIVDGIKYERIAGEEYEMRLFERHEITGYISKMLNTNKSIYDAVVFDSETIEKPFAQALEKMGSVKFYLKLPYWFTIKTPLGPYNPDWAIVKEEEEGFKMYFVAETKGSVLEEDQRGKEKQKIECGKAHFDTIDGVEYRVVTNAGQL